ncbi:uncharacterized protein LOC131631143 [Vicia villosa]|uniref:uncharacterized protein LOC131631143 n=1 Tax=Vicia villosa TaxID=3911 RepID=UPI00273B3FEE|nr:uncharacterized protein LOC131631143 [Vicia villosa]
MYSNPPMDYAYHTPSSHQWSIPPTYSTPTPTPSFPSFPWELFTPYYIHESSSPKLYLNHGYSPHTPTSYPPPPNSYSSSHYSFYYNNHHQPLQPTKTYHTFKKDFDKHLEVSHPSFKKNSKKNSKTILTKSKSSNITLKTISTFSFLKQKPKLLEFTPTPTPSSLLPNSVFVNPLYNENWRNPLPKPQSPSSNAVVYPYTHRLSQIHLQPKSKQIGSQTIASHFNREAKRFHSFGATKESLSKVSTEVFQIGTDVHLYDNPEDVNIVPLRDSRFDFETTHTENSLLVLDDEENFKNNKATYLAVINDADDVSDEASSIESAQDDLLGENDKAKFCLYMRKIERVVSKTFSEPDCCLESSGTDKKNDSVSVPCRQIGVTGRRNYFSPHWSVEAVEKELDRDDVLEAVFHVNAHNRLEMLEIKDLIITGIILPLEGNADKKKEKGVRCQGFGRIESWDISGYMIAREKYGVFVAADESNTVKDRNELVEIHIPIYLSSISKGVATVMVSYSSWNGVVLEQKYELVKRLQNMKHICGMIGDGVNDAPVLKKADIRIVARSASDIVLMEHGFSVIINVVLTNRAIFQRMKNYTIYVVSITIRFVFGFMLSALIWRFDFALFMVLIIAILKDGTIMAISKDRVKASPLPDSWKLKEILASRILFLVSESISWKHHRVNLHNFLMSFSPDACLPLLILCSSGSYDERATRLREGLQWLAGESLSQPNFHIKLPAPAASECKNVLKSIIQGQHLQGNDNILLKLAGKYDGYDGYDLAILVDRTVHVVVLRFRSSNSIYEHEGPALQLENFYQTMHDFLPVSIGDIKMLEVEGAYYEINVVLLLCINIKKIVLLEKEFQLVTQTKMEVHDTQQGREYHCSSVT